MRENLHNLEMHITTQHGRAVSQWDSSFMGLLQFSLAIFWLVYECDGVHVFAQYIFFFFFFYIITDQKFVNPDKFSFRLRIQLNLENEFKNWFKNFQEITQSTHTHTKKTSKTVLQCT